MHATCGYSHEEAGKRAFELMSSKPQGDRLPFEKSKNRKKSAKPQAGTPATAQKAALKESQSPDVATKSMAVPDAVSKRMAKRMAVLCGVPSALGMLTFVISYFVVSHGFKLPNIAVVLVSMGFFGIGVLGLSYGLLSASWDEETSGSLLGWQEFTTNWGRMTSAWRSARSQSD
jgi:hypothetical protein